MKNLNISTRPAYQWYIV